MTGDPFSPHLPCMFCTGTGSKQLTADTWHAVDECPDCQGTGQAITWAAKARLVGGHWRVTIWAGRKGMRAGLGELIMDHDDWHEFQLQAARMSPPMEISSA